MRNAVHSPEHDFPIQLPITKYAELTVENRTRFTIVWTIYTGRGYFNRHYTCVNHKGCCKGWHFAQFRHLHRNKFIIRIENEDDLCCVCALITPKQDLANNQNMSPYERVQESKQLYKARVAINSEKKSIFNMLCLNTNSLVSIYLCQCTYTFSMHLYIFAKRNDCSVFGYVWLICNLPERTLFKQSH